MYEKTRDDGPNFRTGILSPPGTESLWVSPLPRLGSWTSHTCMRRPHDPTFRDDPNGPRPYPRPRSLDGRPPSCYPITLTTDSPGRLHCQVAPTPPHKQVRPSVYPGVRPERTVSRTGVDVVSGTHGSPTSSTTTYRFGWTGPG